MRVCRPCARMLGASSSSLTCVCVSVYVCVRACVACANCPRQSGRRRKSENVCASWSAKRGRFRPPHRVRRLDASTIPFLCRNLRCVRACACLSRARTHTARTAHARTRLRVYARAGIETGFGQDTRDRLRRESREWDTRARDQSETGPRGGRERSGGRYPEGGQFKEAENGRHTRNGLCEWRS